MTTTLETPYANLSSHARVWAPRKGETLSESAVNGMTPDAQWGYRANSSTRPKLGLDFYGPDIFDQLRKRTGKTRAQRGTVVSMPSTPTARLEALRVDHDRAVEKAAKTTKALHAAILEAHEAGMSLRQIAEASGLSFQRVHQLVSKGEK